MESCLKRVAVQATQIVAIALGWMILSCDTASAQSARFQILEPIARAMLVAHQRTSAAHFSVEELGWILRETQLLDSLPEQAAIVQLLLAPASAPRFSALISIPWLIRLTNRDAPFREFVRTQIANRVADRMQFRPLTPQFHPLGYPFDAFVIQLSSHDALYGDPDIDLALQLHTELTPQSRSRLMEVPSSRINAELMSFALGAGLTRYLNSAWAYAQLGTHIQQQFLIRALESGQDWVKGFLTSSVFNSNLSLWDTVEWNPQIGAALQTSLETQVWSYPGRARAMAYYLAHTPDQGQRAEFIRHNLEVVSAEDRTPVLLQLLDLLPSSAPPDAASAAIEAYFETHLWNADHLLQHNLPWLRRLLRNPRTRATARFTHIPYLEQSTLELQMHTHLSISDEQFRISENRVRDLEELRGVREIQDNSLNDPIVTAEWSTWDQNRQNQLRDWVQQTLLNSTTPALPFLNRLTTSMRYSGLRELLRRGLIELGTEFNPPVRLTRSNPRRSQRLSRVQEIQLEAQAREWGSTLPPDIDPRVRSRLIEQRRHRLESTADPGVSDPGNRSVRDLIQARWKNRLTLWLRLHGLQIEISDPPGLHYRPLLETDVEQLALTERDPGLDSTGEVPVLYQGRLVALKASFSSDPMVALHDDAPELAGLLAAHRAAEVFAGWVANWNKALALSGLPASPALLILRREESASLRKAWVQTSRPIAMPFWIALSILRSHRIEFPLERTAIPPGLAALVQDGAVPAPMPAPVSAIGASPESAPLPTAIDLRAIPPSIRFTVSDSAIHYLLRTSPQNVAEIPETAFTNVFAERRGPRVLVQTRDALEFPNGNRMDLARPLQSGNWYQLHRLQIQTANGATLRPGIDFKWADLRVTQTKPPQLAVLFTEPHPAGVRVQSIFTVEVETPAAPPMLPVERVRAEAPHFDEVGLTRIASQLRALPPYREVNTDVLAQAIRRGGVYPNFEGDHPLEPLLNLSGTEAYSAWARFRTPDGYLCAQCALAQTALSALIDRVGLPPGWRHEPLVVELVQDGVVGNQAHVIEGMWRAAEPDRSRVVAPTQSNFYWIDPTPNPTHERPVTPSRPRPSMLRSAHRWVGERIVLTTDSLQRIWATLAQRSSTQLIAPLLPPSRDESSPTNEADTLERAEQALIQEFQTIGRRSSLAYRSTVQATRILLRFYRILAADPGRWASVSAELQEQRALRGVFETWPSSPAQFISQLQFWLTRRLESHRALPNSPALLVVWSELARQTKYDCVLEQIRKAP